MGVIHTTGPKAVRLARKYAPPVAVLADLVARSDTPLSPRAAYTRWESQSVTTMRIGALAPVVMGRSGLTVGRRSPRPAGGAGPPEDPAASFLPFPVSGMAGSPGRFGPEEREGVNIWGENGFECVF